MKQTIYVINDEAALSTTHRLGVFKTLQRRIVTHHKMVSIYFKMNHTYTYNNKIIIIIIKKRHKHTSQLI